MSDTSTQNGQERIIDKIRKILALAQNSGATEAEAEVAMGKVHELLAQHQLDMSMLKIDVESNEEATLARTPGTNNMWEVSIFNGAAQLNFCDYFYDKETGKVSHNLIGKPLNIKCAVMLAEYLIEAVHRLARDAAVPGRGACPGDLTIVELKQWRWNFKVGAGTRLRSRCVKLKEQRSQQATKTSTGSNLPALLKTYEVARVENDGVKQKLGIKTTSRKSTVKFTDGHAAGMKAADDISLEGKLGGRDKPAGLLN